MTNILVCSDLHVDFHADHGSGMCNSLDKSADILVFAGDLTTSYGLENALIKLCKKRKHVVFVPGNHEYYGSNFDAVDLKLMEMERRLPNLTVLNSRRVTIDGVNFIGATLWIPGSPSAKGLKHALNDFRYIKNCDPLAFDRYDATVKYFYANMQKGDIVVTHHLPSYNSVGAQFVGSQLNCYFASHLDSLILDKEPALWIHGHTHIACDYTIGNTRVVCNPLGYPSEWSGYKDNLKIEV